MRTCDPPPIYGTVPLFAWAVLSIVLGADVLQCLSHCENRCCNVQYHSHHKPRVVGLTRVFPHSLPPCHSFTALKIPQHPRVGGRSAPADYEEMEAIAHAIRGASAADQEGRETPHRSFAGGFERRRSPTPAPSSRSGSERRSSPPQSADASGISVASSRAPTEDENEEKGKEMVGKRKRMNASSAVVDTAKERNAAFQGVVGRSAGEGWAKSSSPTRSSTTITASGGVGSSADVENVVDERATAALSNMKNNNATSFDYDDESKAVKRSRPASTSPVDDKLSADEKAQGEVSAAARASSSIAQEEKAEKTETTENGDNQGEIGTATETRSLPSKSGRSPRDINTLPQSVETPVEKLLSKR